MANLVVNSSVIPILKLILWQIKLQLYLQVQQIFLISIFATFAEDSIMHFFLKNRINHSTVYEFSIATYIIRRD